MGQQKGYCALCKQGSDNFKTEKMLSIIIVGVGVVTVVITINPLKTKRRLLYLKTQFIPGSKHISSRL